MSEYTTLAEDIAANIALIRGCEEDIQSIVDNTPEDEPIDYEDIDHIYELQMYAEDELTELFKDWDMIYNGPTLEEMMEAA